MTHNEVNPLPGSHLTISKMPGHWVLAQMGKRVLRPGGLELTQEMLDALSIGESDSVVELAPGLGATARLALEKKPLAYTGIERDDDAANRVRKFLNSPSYKCETGSASNTGLDTESATVVYGEAMLTMQTESQKRVIIREALRVLKPGGRYAIHELGLTPDNLSNEIKSEIKKDLSKVIHVGARPLTISEWRELLESEGFVVKSEFTAPMHLLEPGRLLRDEGIRGVLRILFNVAKTPAARRRILAMRKMFRKHEELLCAVSLVAEKPATGLN